MYLYGVVLSEVSAKSHAGDLVTKNYPKRLHKDAVFLQTAEALSAINESMNDP